MTAQIPIVQIDVDIGSSSSVARSVIGLVPGYVSSMVNVDHALDKLQARSLSR